MPETDAKPQHTPGPWQLTGCRKASNFGNWTAFVQAPESMVTIAKALGGRADSCAVARANARLIAAAPDLLAALHRCISALAANDAPNCEAVKEARAAIAKAEG